MHTGCRQHWTHCATHFAAWCASLLLACCSGVPSAIHPCGGCCVYMTCWVSCGCAEHVAVSSCCRHLCRWHSSCCFWCVLRCETSHSACEQMQRHIVTVRRRTCTYMLQEHQDVAAACPLNWHLHPLLLHNRTCCCHYVCGQQHTRCTRAVMPLLLKRSCSSCMIACSSRAGGHNPR